MCCYLKNELRTLLIEFLNIYMFRAALARFRCSAHCLEVEKRRHKNVTMEIRIYKFCNEKGIIAIEDEYHFVMQCLQYQLLRTKYIDKKYLQNINFETFIKLV